MRGMQGLQDMRASAVEPVRGRENLDVAGRDADGAFAAGQQDFLLGFEPDLGGVELNALPIHGELGDRKSTRLNSSHQIISYAVFCLKKKKRNEYLRIRQTVDMAITMIMYTLTPILHV